MLKPKSEWRPGIKKSDIIAELDSKLQIPGVRNGWTQPIITELICYRQESEPILVLKFLEIILIHLNIMLSGRKYSEECSGGC